jgi:hypothetical protein
VIAYMDDTIGTRGNKVIIDEGVWQVYAVTYREPIKKLSKAELQAPVKAPNGFRSSPLNPGKRLPSSRKKRK